MRLNMALPCRISVSTDKGKTRTGLVRPVKILSALSQDDALIQAVTENIASAFRSRIRESTGHPGRYARS